MRAHGRLANLSVGVWPEARRGCSGPRQKTALAATQALTRALAGPLMPASLRHPRKIMTSTANGVKVRDTRVANRTWRGWEGEPVRSSFPYVV